MTGHLTRTGGSRRNRSHKKPMWWATALLAAAAVVHLVLAGCGALPSLTPAYTSPEAFIEDLNSTGRARRLGVARAVRADAGELRLYVTRRWYDHPIPPERRLVAARPPE